MAIDFFFSNIYVFRTPEPSGKMRMGAKLMAHVMRLMLQEIFRPTIVSVTTGEDESAKQYASVFLERDLLDGSSNRMLELPPSTVDQRLNNFHTDDRDLVQRGLDRGRSWSLRNATSPYDTHLAAGIFNTRAGRSLLRTKGPEALSVIDELLGKEGSHLVCGLDAGVMEWVYLRLAERTSHGQKLDLSEFRDRFFGPGEGFVVELKRVDGRSTHMPRMTKLYLPPQFNRYVRRLAHVEEQA